jgi:hypothetical protein
MAGETQDLTIGGIVRTAGPVLSQAPSDLEKVKKAIDSILRTDYLPNSPDGSALISKIAAVRAGIDSGLMTAEEAVDATTKLLKQFSLPLAIVGGVKLKGSGELVDVGERVWQGLKSSMTQWNKVQNIVLGILYVLCSTYTAATAVFPAIGDYKIGLGGLALSTLFGGIARLVSVWKSDYPDVKRAELVKLP